MKNAYWLILLLPAMAIAQEKKMEVGILFGNNGQLDKTLNDFYFFGHETHYLDDSSEGIGVNLKFGATGRFFFTDNISARLRLGYAIRKGHDIADYTNTYAEYTLNQSVFNSNPAICFSKKIDKIEIATGIELPLMFVRDFTLVVEYKELPDGVTVTYNSKDKMKMTGGFVWGINNFIGVKYLITDALAIGGEIDYGILFAKLGDKIELNAESTIPVEASSSWTVDKKYKKIFFSTPEVSLGIFYRFGSTISCVGPRK
jgi:hypothetical protein